MPNIAEHEKEAQICIMLAARFQLEHPVLAMGVSQRQQNFSPSESTEGVYFAFSDNYSAARENDTDGASDYEVVEKSDLDSTSTESETSFPAPSLTAGPRAEANEDHGDARACPVGSNEETATPCVRPKHGVAIIGVPDSLLPEAQQAKKETTKKKKKWRAVNAEEMGFKLTLFPREPVANDSTDRETEFYEVLEAELDSVGDKIRPFQHLLQLEGSGLAKKEKFLRRDSDRREEKAHRQVKSKNVTSVLNNRGRKTLYIHFRLYKMHPFLHCSNLQHPNLPSSPKKGSVCMEVAKAAANALQRSAVNQGFTSSSQGRRAPPPQNLTYALDHASHAARELPTDIISFLINIQHREMTPEDYEILLRLDEGIAPKTVAQDIVSTFKTDVVDESTVGGVCSVCMEAYELGQQRKFLPCEHMFHVQCIDMWLTNSSQNCPLDGLPVGLS